MSVPHSHPHNIEAERSILGGILLYSKAMPEVSGRVDSSDFYHPTHRAIFEAMLALDSGSKPIDALTVSASMRASGKIKELAALNGESYFADLMSAVVTIENIRYHAGIVRNLSTLRRLIETAQGIAARGYGDVGDVAEFLAESQEKICQIAQRDIGSQLVSQQQSLRETLALVESAFEQNKNGGPPPVISTGFRDIDDHLGGGLQSEFILVGGRPSSGKSAFCLDFSEYAARCTIPTLVISTEMRHTAQTMRRLSAMSQVDGHKLRRGNLSDVEYVAITRAASELSDATLWYEDTARDMESLRSIMRRWRVNPSQGGRLGVDGKPMRALIVVDYLQEIQLRNERDDDAGRQRFSNRDAELSKIGASLKDLQKALDVTLVAVSSLNRELEKREDKRPRNSDLRECGALEFQADTIAFVYRDAVYNATADHREAEIIFTKARNGKLGTVHLDWWAEFTSFRNRAQQRYVEPAATGARSTWHDLRD